VTISTAARWTTESIPDQSGRVAVITGGNGGLGLATARELAHRGAEVVLACRDTGRGRAAAAAIRGAVPAAHVRVEQLDLADLATVRRLSERLAARHERIDLLINNAGIMATPHRTTPEGVELQLATNHLGHFALTGLLLERLLAARDPRVVTVSSIFHRVGNVDVDRLRGGRYHRWRAYARSKLANLLFALELERRARAAGTALRSMAAHPGYADTKLLSAGFERAPARIAMAVAGRAFAQGPYMAALPILYAATVPDLAGGTFVGPGGATGLHGLPKPARPAARARDADNAARLWRASEQLTAVTYGFRTAAGSARAA
jgi:NAD(P)-dependent dehydrogenase (short-subunit alcohol dehydrogenase family)